jgi:hypothetical protein
MADNERGRFCQSAASNTRSRPESSETGLEDTARPDPSGQES